MTLLNHDFNKKEMNSYKILFGKPERKRQDERTILKWIKYIKCGLDSTGSG